MSDLTGGLSPGRLRRLSRNGSLTVTVVRRVVPGAEGFFGSWSVRMVEAVRRFPGCLGAAALAAGDGREFQMVFRMVFRFVDADALREWERSGERSLLLAELDSVLEEERVTTLPGDEFLASLVSVRRRRPLPVRVLVDVAWVFPAAFLWSAFLAPWFAGLPAAAGTLVSASVITFLAESVLVPLRRGLLRCRGLPAGRSACSPVACRAAGFFR